MPGAGGPYIYLREAFNRHTWGRLLSFLFIWEVVLIAPLSAASGGVGFAAYLKYFWHDMTPLESRLVAMAVCAAVTILLYRGIKSVARLGVAMLVVVLSTVAWVIVAGVTHFSFARAFSFPPHAFDVTPSFVQALGAATLIAIYDYGGYNNICYLGGEVKEGARTIPRAIILSIVAVAALYLLMSTSIIGVIPWREAMHSTSIASDLLARVYGSWAGAAVTVLILGATFAALFALMLGYSRIPYAAAIDGAFFRPFARLHPKERFPHVSLVVIGAASVALCWFSLEAIIKALIVIQIVIQSLAQVVAVTAIRRYRRDIGLPFGCGSIRSPASSRSRCGRSSWSRPGGSTSRAGSPRSSPESRSSSRARATAVSGRSQTLRSLPECGRR